MKNSEFLWNLLFLFLNHFITSDKFPNVVLLMNTKNTEDRSFYLPSKFCCLFASSMELSESFCRTAFLSSPVFLIYPAFIAISEDGYHKTIQPVCFRTLLTFCNTTFSSPMRFGLSLPHFTASFKMLPSYLEFFTWLILPSRIYNLRFSSRWWYLLYSCTW